MRDVRPALGVYVVSSSTFVEGRDHASVLRSAIAGGASALQLRAPELSDAEILPVATELAAACRTAGVLFIVNDRIDAAEASGAAGVHVGQDVDLLEARRRAGAGLVLGVSVGDEGEVRAAERAGADYLGVTVWATPTKPEAVGRGLDGLRAIAAATALPVVGIGGISPANAELVLEAGAAGVAVISAVGAAADPTGATAELVDVVRRFRARTGVAS